MAIEDPKNQFRLRILVWGGNYRGEQPLTSAPQPSLEDVLDLYRNIRDSGLHPHIRSYVISENVGTGIGSGIWQALDYSDWKDLQ